MDDRYKKTAEDVNGELKHKSESSLSPDSQQY